MKRWIGCAGHAGFTSDHIWAVLKIFASSSLVTLLRKVFALLTVTARASVPTRNSIGVRPIFLAFSISFALMPRLALAISVSPATVKRSNPAPLPILSIVMLPLYPSSLKRSAILSERGKTVELPAVVILPVTFNGLTPGSPWTLGPSIQARELPAAAGWAFSWAPPATNGARAANARIRTISFLIFSSIGILFNQKVVVKCEKSVTKT